MEREGSSTENGTETERLRVRLRTELEDDNEDVARQWPSDLA